MAVLSVCRKALLPLRQANVVTKRYGGHGHRMFVVPSSYMWKKTKDVWHLYFLVGAIPCALLSLYLSVFYGDAQLREIPEGYEPEPWEYERHPLTRFIVKYLTPDTKEMYERRAYFLNEEMQNLLIDRVCRRADYLMSIRRDFKSWYYRDYSAKMLRQQRERAHNLQFYKGVTDEDFSGATGPTD